MGNVFSLHEFTEVFQVRNLDGIPYVLVGGQAVNYWAERYLAKEPELRKYAPFTSGDIDFRGNRGDVRHVAAQLRLAPVFPGNVTRTALAGIIPIRIGKNPTSIEIVRLIPGVPAALVDAMAINAEFGGWRIRVLDPISLLQCKVNLVLSLSQESRQDGGHLQILVFCVRGFLRDALQEVESGNVSAKGWLGAVNRLVKLAKSTYGRKAAKKLGIRWVEILPLPEIAQSQNEKLIAFRELQLGRAFDPEPK